MTQNKESESKELEGVTSSEESLEKTPLTVATLRKFICPKATDQELVLFRELCLANGCNPFTGDAYLVKFGNEKAQMIVSEGFFNKQVHSIQGLKGVRDGIIIKDSEGAIQEKEGEFYTEGEKLVGGWAEIIVDGKEPFKSKVRLVDYDKGQATWKKIAARMICKVARVSAIRKADPGMKDLYISEETGVMEAIATPNFQTIEPSNPISKTGVEILRNMLETAGKPEAEFCEAMKIDKIDELPSSKFERVISRLNEIISANT